MKKLFFIAGLFVCVNNSAKLVCAQTTQVTRAVVSAPGLVVGLFHFLKERPLETYAFSGGVLVGCYLWRNDILQSLQATIRILDRWINPNETEEEKEEEDYSTIDITPFMPILTETPVGREMLNKLKSQNLTQEEYDQRIREIFVGRYISEDEIAAQASQPSRTMQTDVSKQNNLNAAQLQQTNSSDQNRHQEQSNISEKGCSTVPLQEESVVLDRHMQMQPTETSKETNQEAPKNEQKQPEVPTQRVTEIAPQEKQPVQHTEEELLVIHLSEHYTKENHAKHVLELTTHESFKLLRCFLSAHTLKASNLVKWCILDALAQQLATKEKAAQKISLRDILRDHAERDALLGALSEKAIFQLPEMIEVRTFKPDWTIQNILFSENNKFFAAVSDGHIAKVINLENGNIQTITHNTWSWYVPFGTDGKIWNSKFSPDGKFFATVSNDCAAKIINLENGNIQTISHTDKIGDIVFSPDSKLFATSSMDQTVQVLHLENGSTKTIIHDSPLCKITFGPDSKFVAATSTNHEAKIINLENKDTYIMTHHYQPINIFNHLRDPKSSRKGFILDIAFSRNNRFFATASTDHTAKIMNLTNQSTQTITHSAEVRRITFSEDEKFAVTISDDHTSKVMNLENGSIQTMGHNDKILGVTFSEDGKSCTTISDDNTSKIMNLENGSIQSIGHNKKAPQVVSGTDEIITFSPDGKFVATASKDGSTKIMLLQLDNFVEYLEHRIAEEQKKVCAKK